MRKKKGYARIRRGNQYKTLRIKIKKEKKRKKKESYEKKNPSTTCKSEE